MTRVYNPERSRLFAEMFIEDAKTFAKYGTCTPTEEQKAQVDEPPLRTPEPLPLETKDCDSSKIGEK